MLLQMARMSGHEFSVVVGDGAREQAESALGLNHGLPLQVVPLGRLQDRRFDLVLLDASAALEAVAYYEGLCKEATAAGRALLGALQSENRSLRARVEELSGEVESYKAMAPKLERELARLQQKLDESRGEEA
ncbi:MAG: hypothetical protein ABIL09_13000 [Gemmatimonadota bacterium]